MDKNITSRIDSIIVKIAQSLDPVATAFIPILSDLKQEIMERDYRINLLQNSIAEVEKSAERQAVHAYKEGYDDGYSTASEDACGGVIANHVQG